MTLHKLATNVLIHSLTLNLDSYAPGRKDIDQFTLNLLEKLLAKILAFTKDADLMPFKGNKDEAKLALQFYSQQANSVHCQICHAFFTDYDKIMAHLTNNSHKQPLAKDGATTNSSFLDKNCIPHSTENLPKAVKKLLKTDFKMLMKQLQVEADFTASDCIQSVLQQELESIVKTKYPFAQGYPFGSRFVGTAGLLSDVDIFLDLEEKYKFTESGKACSSLSPTAIKESIECVKNLIKKEANDWLVKDACLAARVPVLRVKSLKHDTNCDIIFSNGLSHRNSMWLWYMFHLQPSSRSLVCYLKHWNAEDCLNTYTISLMVVFFFQCRNLLPSVHLLQNDGKRAKFIDGWNTDFARPTLKKLGYQLCGESTLTLAQQFFTFYSKTFSLETDVVCPFLGCTGIKKRQFHEATYENFPSEMGLLWEYLNKLEESSEAKHTSFAYNRPFFVQDPFELNHNVAKGIPIGKASKYLRLMQLSAEYLSQGMLLKAKLPMSNFHRKVT